MLEKKVQRYILDFGQADIGDRTWSSGLVALTKVGTSTMGEGNVELLH
jgi:hypothetical protein